MKILNVGHNYNQLRLYATKFPLLFLRNQKLAILSQVTKDQYTVKNKS